LLQKANKHVPRPLEALGAGTEIGGITGPHGVSTVPANKPTIPVSGHLSKISTAKKQYGHRKTKTVSVSIRA